jgi:regulator of RNase E activity RraB
MTGQYPDDSDGHALQRVANDGNDMERPMDVDFPVVFADQTIAERFAAIAQKYGYETKLWQHEEEDAGDWDVVCVRRMILTYDAVLAVQSELNELSGPLGGYSDGWGTFGNKDD